MRKYRSECRDDPSVRTSEVLDEMARNPLLPRLSEIASEPRGATSKLNIHVVKKQQERPK